MPGDTTFGDHGSFPVTFVRAKQAFPLFSSSVALFSSYVRVFCLHFFVLAAFLSCLPTCSTIPLWFSSVILCSCRRGLERPPVSRREPVCQGCCCRLVAATHLARRWTPVWPRRAVHADARRPSRCASRTRPSPVQQRRRFVAQKGSLVVLLV